jgi:hypothetical protein
MPRTSDSSPPVFPDDAHRLSFLPGVPGDWSTPPADIGSGLDALAAGGGGGATQLSDLSDVSSVDYTAAKTLRANGSGYVSSYLQLADLSDVAAKTGSGTTVVMSVAPTIASPTIVNFTNSTHTHQNAFGGGQLDHGSALTGLADDDHTQYALLAGRAGGQTVIGGTGASDGLLLKTNSNGTPSGDSVTINAGGANHSDFATDASFGSQLAIGHTTHGTLFGGDMVEVRNLDGGSYGSALAMYAMVDHATRGAVVRLGKGRGSWTSPGNLQDGDEIGGIKGVGYHTSWHNSRGAIIFEANSPTSSDVPIDFVFSTGTSSLVERLRIAAGGDTTILSGALVMTSGLHLEFGSADAYITNNGSSLNLYGNDIRHYVPNGKSHEFYVNSNLEVDIRTSEMYLYNGVVGQSRIVWSNSVYSNLMWNSSVKFTWGNNGIGFFSTSVASQQTVTGARDDPESALANLLTALAAYGLIVDSTTTS